MRYLYLLLLISGSLQGLAQDAVFPALSYPANYFRYPLDIPVKLNANFGEMRPNHFHMGLDLFTERRENLPVYAAAEGYIARIKIDPKGFGNAIYLNHPNGYTTLYAHMNTFPPQLLGAIMEGQYANEQWNGDVEFKAYRFPVKKGQFIGFSGNTGASAGPHVHYEIRRTIDDGCLNALLFHQVYDVTPPDITRLALYDRNRSTYEQMPRMLQPVRVADGYSLAGGTVVTTSNRVSFALVVTDRVTGVSNSNGIFEAVVYVDNQPVSGFRLNDIDYLQTRYLNAHIDYRLKINGGAYLQHLTPLPGNRLPLYFTRGDGFILLPDTMARQVKIVVKDANGNASVLRFTLRRSGAIPAVPDTERDSRYMQPNQINIFERNDIQLVSTERSFYDAFRFVYNYKPNAAAVSNIHIMHTPLIPVHDSITYRIRPNKPIAESARNRVIMIKSARNKTVVSRTKSVNGWYEARFRELGELWLEVDEEPPTLTVAGVSDGAVLTEGILITCTVSDNKKTIRRFRAELNGNWLLFTGLGPVFRYKVDAYCPPGAHILKLLVEDEAGNITERIIRFTRI